MTPAIHRVSIAFSCVTLIGFALLARVDPDQDARFWLESRLSVHNYASRYRQDHLTRQYLPGLTFEAGVSSVARSLAWAPCDEVDAELSRWAVDADKG